jgi:biopolymer transport protein TolR
MARVRKRRLMGEINVVPYIDVMLVLLIIFMVTAPLLNKGVEVDLPGAAAEALQDAGRDAEPIVLTISRVGDLFLNVAPSPTVALAPLDVVNFAGRVLEATPERQVLVKADKLVPYGEVVNGMVLLQQAGATTVGFVTDPSAVDERS